MVYDPRKMNLARIISEMEPKFLFGISFTGFIVRSVARVITGHHPITLH